MTDVSSIDALISLYILILSAEYLFRTRPTYTSLRTRKLPYLPLPLQKSLSSLNKSLFSP